MLNEFSLFFDKIGIEPKTKVSELVQINSEIDNSIKFYSFKILYPLNSFENSIEFDKL